MKKIKHLKKKDGTVEKQSMNLKKLLCLNYLNLTNLTEYSGKYDFPKLYCNTDVFPDYIALENEPGKYRLTDLTCVAFFEYDNEFDGQHGLYNAIYYNNKADLAEFKEKYQGIKFVITPDYSLIGDNDEVENLYRLKKSRVDGLWFLHEIGAMVIPLFTFPRIDSMETYIAGLENCSVIAMSTKGHMQKTEDYKDLCKAVDFVVKKIPLKAIVVYDVCGSNDKTLKAFESAIQKGIKIIIPPNTLKIRNEQKRRKAK